MKIDIFDTTVPDYSILDKKSLMERGRQLPSERKKDTIPF